MTSILAEYGGTAALLRAVHVLRGRGYTRLEIYTPHPVRDADLALGARRSRLPWLVALAGVSGAIGAYALQWLLDAYLYPVDAGGRPPHSPLAFVPITFEMGVLAAGVTAFLGVLALGRLVRLWHPVFEAPGFASATRAGYWLLVDGRDPIFDAGRAQRDVRTTGPARITTVEGEP
jgi:Alternative complex III, ActD subunit